MAYLDALKATFELCKYEPSAEQWPVHLDRNRLKVIAGGERGGKSKVGAMEVVKVKILNGARLIWVVGNEYRQCKGDWDHIVNGFDSIGMVKKCTPRIDPGMILLVDGTEIATKSGQDSRTLSGEAPDFILIAEAAQCDYEVWLKCLSRALEKSATVMASGTFEGSYGWYVDLFNAYQNPDNPDGGKSYSIPSWSNLAIFPGGRNDPKIVDLERLLPHDRFMERHGGIPSKPDKLIPKEFNCRVHVREMAEFDHNCPVELAVDPGYNNAYAVLAIQEVNGVVRIIDELYYRGIITKDMVRLCQKKPWWSAVTGGVIDVAGRQHQAMEAPITIWNEEGLIHLRSQKVGIEDGIERLRTTLQIDPITLLPGILIHPRCKGIISEFGGGPSPLGREFNGSWQRDEAGQPIDRYNHSAKSLIYWLVDHLGYSPSLSNRRTYKRVGREIEES